MDLIDRESILKEIDNEWKTAHRGWYKIADYSPYEDGYNRARQNDLHILSEIVLAAPSVWHKASDKPEEETDLIFYYLKEYESTVFQFYEVARYREGRFLIGDSYFEYEEVPVENIIAWMYVPKPPDDFYPEGFFNEEKTEGLVKTD